MAAAKKHPRPQQREPSLREKLLAAVSWKADSSALQLRDVGISALSLAGCAVDKLKEFAQVFLLQQFRLREFYSHSKGRCAARDHASQDHAFYPNLAVGHPQPDADA